MKPGLSTLPVGTGLIAVASVAATFLAVAGAFSVGERSALLAGEWWRLWSAHGVHFAPAHLLGSGLVWLVAGGLLETEDRKGWWLVVGVAAPVVTFAALAGDGELVRYGGLSGLATAAAACLCMLWLMRESGGRRLVGGAVLAVIGLKVGLEWMVPDRSWLMALSEGGEGAGDGRPVRVARWAHAAGLAAGVGIAAGRLWLGGGGKDEG